MLCALHCVRCVALRCAVLLHAFWQFIVRKHINDEMIASAAEFLQSRKGIVELTTQGEYHHVPTGCFLQRDQPTKVDCSILGVS